VLHPNQRKSPYTAIDLGGTRTALPDTCSFIRENTLGELGISVLLRALDENSKPEAWTGWDGDRYLVAECEGKPELLWLTLWDSQTDALEFETAYRGLSGALVARSSLALAPAIVRDGRETLIYSDAFAGFAGELAAAAPRRQIATLSELREHYEESSR